MNQIPGEEVVASPPEEATVPTEPVKEQELPETTTPTEVPSGVEHTNTNEEPL